MRYLIILLALAAEALAGNDNPGPGSDKVQALWSTPTTVTTLGATTTSYWPIGLDAQISVDINVQNAATSAQVTITALFQMPGGNIVAYPVEALPSEQYTWQQGSDPASALFGVYPPHGAERMYLNAITSDSDGVSITARAIGR